MAISQFSTMEDTVETAIASNPVKPSPDWLNKIVSAQVIKVQEILVSVSAKLRA